jgi:hypothetical protein
MFASSNNLELLSGIPGCLLGSSIVVGAARGLWLLNDCMPLFFGVKYGDVKFWITLFDPKRHLLGRLIRFASGLELPIDGNTKWFGQGWFTDCSRRGC